MPCSDQPNASYFQTNNLQYGALLRYKVICTANGQLLYNEQPVLKHSRSRMALPSDWSVILVFKQITHKSISCIFIIVISYVQSHSYHLLAQNTQKRNFFVSCFPHRPATEDTKILQNLPHAQQPQPLTVGAMWYNSSMRLKSSFPLLSL